MTINNKVLVTGSKGFVGTHLCNYLEEKGFQVVTTVNKQKPFDVTNIDQLLTIESVDAIVHLAAKTSISDSFKKPSETYYTNFVGTLNVLEFAKTRNIKKLIYVSTYVYGQPEYFPLDEKHPVNPHSPYNNSKLLAEKICQNYSHYFGINIVTLRPFYVYGPNSRNGSFIPSIIKQIKANGRVKLSGKRVRRDFLFVTDFVYLIEKILQDFPKGYNTYNVGYGKSYSLYQVAKELSRLIGKKIEIKFSNSTNPDVSDMIADIRKVSKEFNWRPAIDIKKGLQLIVEGPRS
jgi:UDP-glucose 4-epimerase